MKQVCTIILTKKVASYLFVFSILFISSISRGGEKEDRQLFDAVRSDDLGKAKGAIVAGANVNAVETKKYGNTALHLAVKRGSKAMVKLLLQNRANVNLTTVRKSTPLDLARSTKNNAIETLLLDYFKKDSENENRQLLPFESKRVESKGSGPLEIPPESKSAFEHIFGGRKIPTDFQEFRRAILESKNLKISTARQIFVPHGRSTQKDKTNFEKPRIIATFLEKRESGDAQTNGIFVGYSEAAEQVEVISWDPDASKFRFYIVEDFAHGKTPKTTQIRDNSCFACHQNKAPIYPSGPWSEMTVPLSLDDGRSHVDPRSTFRSEFLKFHPTGIYQGVSLDDTRGDVPRLDGEVREANFGVELVRACQSICGESLVCRKFLLQAALEKQLLNHDIFPEGKSVSDFKIKSRVGGSVIDAPTPTEVVLQLIKSSWPKDGFGGPSSVIPDRNPFTNIGFKRLKDDSKKDITYFGNDSLNRTDITSNGSGSSDVPLGEDEMDKLDPIHPRPRDSRLDDSAIGVSNDNQSLIFFLFSMSHCMTDYLGGSSLKKTDLDYLRPHLSKREDIERVLDTKQVEIALKEWPPKKNALMYALLETASGSGSEIASCYLPESKTGASFEELKSVVSSVLTQPIPIKRNAVDKFKFYCASCHTPPEGKNTPLPLENLKKLTTYRDKRGRSILDRIRKDMPPRSKDFEKENKSWVGDSKIMTDGLKVE